MSGTAVWPYALPQGDPRHGTTANGFPYGYRDLGCHCPDCKHANAAYQRAYRAAHPDYVARQNTKAVERRHTKYRLVCPACGSEMSGGNGAGRDPDRCLACHLAATEPAHGTTSRYTSSKWRCRCAACRAANTAAHREWQQRKRLASSGGTPATAQRSSPESDPQEINEARAAQPCPGARREPETGG